MLAKLKFKRSKRKSSNTRSRATAHVKTIVFMRELTQKYSNFPFLSLKKKSLKIVRSYPIGQQKRKPLFVS